MAAELKGAVASQLNSNAPYFFYTDKVGSESWVLRRKFWALYCFEKIKLQKKTKENH